MFDEKGYYYELRYGAWGPLYIMDYKPDFYSDSIANPYGPGILYRTDKIARILPDGTLDFLENHGSIVFNKGNNYYDLGKLERVLENFEDISKAEAYMSYNPSINKMSLKCNIKSKVKPNMVKLKDYIEKKCGEKLVPEEILYTGTY